MWGVHNWGTETCEGTKEERVINQKHQNTHPFQNNHKQPEEHHNTALAGHVQLVVAK
jgi:hypothetical protein